MVRPCRSHNRRRHHSAWWCVWIAVLSGAVFIGSISSASAEITVPPELQRRIDESIARGVASLKQASLQPGTGAGALAAYALLKAKEPATLPQIVRQRDGALAKIRRGDYGSGPEPAFHIYEACCDAMLLEALGAENYQPEFVILRDYLIEKQRGTGGWDYPHQMASNAGDTSITQYGVLGLWAVHRSGAPISRGVLSKAGKFHERTQRSSGGFAYHPFAAGNPQEGNSTATMTAAGLGSLLITQLLLYGDAEIQDAPRVSSRRFGVLERKSDEPTAKVAKSLTGEATISREVLSRMIRSAERNLQTRFEEGLQSPFPVYFLYTCERISAISGNDKIGDVDWYTRGCEYLFQTQRPDGSWSANTAFPAGADTALALLFLTRSTQAHVQRRPPRPVGGGLLVGGRGLPTDLAAISVQGGEVTKSVPKTEVNLLLDELEQTTEVALPTDPIKLPEIVELDDPKQLIGQQERLLRLLKHANPDVRQLAVWALARSNDIRQVPALIEMLNDGDLVVAWEASLALCQLARFPMGITPAGAKVPLPVDPPGVLEADFDLQAERNAPQIKAWRSAAVAAWDAWYQQVRPYDERDDRRQLQKR